ncbi:TlpA family protein disulfide reductase [Pedobacter frigidisoli]|uniref:TlpA family protein disulfide reductase n=1 Tax=Pedobacter frigidisoli TaxID=2530455 RepID=UPI00292EDE0A|nr:TlpA family protein disulfide reductase [Pedobacter frigidisoli]
MKKTTLLIVMALLCQFFSVYAQGVAENKALVKPLNIGDRVPNLTFTNVINGDRQTMRLSDFKGKAIVLDFWATWCSACIKFFPKMYDLQSRYGKNLQVILIDDSESDTKEKVEAFVAKRIGNEDEISLPVAFHDSLTKALFPHRMFPHYVWIGADRRVKAITAVADLNTANIENFIAGRSLYLKRKEY